MKKKNILVFFTDQQRADTCGCYGQPLSTTPNLDKFAKNATLFENAYTCQPVCGPVRASIQSGLYPTKIGCHRNGIAMPTNIPTIAKLLDEAGYQTAYVGKWHLASTGGLIDNETTPIPQEYRGGYKDYWAAADVLEFTSHGYGGYVFDKDNNKLEFDGYRVDCITDYALDFLNNYESEQPFFLFLSHLEPHHQNDHNHFEGPIGSKEKFANFIPPQDLVNLKGDWKEEYPDYLGCIERLDYNFGRVLKTLEKKGILDDTIIIFTSDHGSHFRTRNNEYKRSCHDSSIHVPFVISGGQFIGGKRLDNIISLIDLPTTILGCANIKAPNFDGRDLNMIVDGTMSGDDYVAFIQLREIYIARAIRTKRYTYEIAAPHKKALTDYNSTVYEENYLYDNLVDPHQQNNLIADISYLNVKKDLQKIIVDKIKKYENMSVEIIGK